MIVYLETSAAAKLLVEEAGSASCARYLDALTEEDLFVSSAPRRQRARRRPVDDARWQSLVA